MCTRILRFVCPGRGQAANYNLFEHRTKNGAARTAQSALFSMVCLGEAFGDDWLGDEFPGDDGLRSAQTAFDARVAGSQERGPVFQSQVRVSQHLCAPLLNPNHRIGCSAPLNYDSSHLPPELRDFRLECRDVRWDFLPGTGSKTLESLVLYEFNGGNQKQEAAPSLLHLPQFRVSQAASVGEAFDLEIFSPYGMPSYIAVFARDSDFSIDSERQPLIKRLSIMNTTTMKKSNTILDAREHELYHMTQRNVHPRARYDRKRYRFRQVVLLSAEDIGMMGIPEYQVIKRSVYRLTGLVDQSAVITALFVFNNRGLMVKGREISVVRV